MTPVQQLETVKALLQALEGANPFKFHVVRMKSVKENFSADKVATSKRASWLLGLSLDAGLFNVPFLTAFGFGAIGATEALQRLQQYRFLDLSQKHVTNESYALVMCTRLCTEAEVSLLVT